MPVSKFSARWTPNAAFVGQRLNSMGEKIIELVHKGLVRNAELMAAELKQTTPRSNDASLDAIDTIFGQPSDHVADGWDAKIISADSISGGRDAGGRFQGKVDFAVEVANENPRFDAPITTSSGGNTSLGMILEFGSRPHTITAKPGKTLMFFWPAVGEVVATKSVQHPGTRPYGLMLMATAEATTRASKLLRAAQKVMDDYDLGFQGGGPRT